MPAQPTSPQPSASRAAAADPPRWLSWGFRALALALGAMHTAVAVHSQSMNEDGVSYLDLGDAWWHGDWQHVINTTWSPLYAWIVGAVTNLAHPSVWWEFPTVQITNFGIYALTLLCFEHFWRQLSARYYAARPGEGEVARIPLLAWYAIGYSLFIYASLNLVEIWAATPDMCVAAFVYLAAGQVMRLEIPDARPSTAVWLGVVLAFGYLAKAAMFPLGLVCIVLAAVMSGSPLSRWARLSRSLVVFAIVAAPLVIAISSSVGHPAFGDVGRFAYMKHVNQMHWPDWQEAAGRLNGTPLHPPRLINADPPAWEFAEPIAGTYPLTYDPAWWTRGLEPRFDVGQQLQSVGGNVMYLFDLFVRMQGGLLTVVLVLVILSYLSVRRRFRLDSAAAMALWALAAVGMYSLVYVEARYIAPFVLLLWAGLLAEVRLPANESYARVASVSGAALALLVWVNIGALNLQGLSGVLGFRPTHEKLVQSAASSSLDNGPEADHPAIAAALKELGLKEGDRVAFIGYSYSAYWARLARVKIVAEIRPADAERFWSAGAAHQADVLKAFLEAGAAAVVAESPGAGSTAGQWRAVGDTSYAVQLLRR